MRSSRPLRICAVGDISFEGPAADEPTVRCVSEDIANRLRRADLAVGNLECVLTSSGCQGIPGKCTLRASPDWAGVLRQAGIGLVSLANNHIMDFGPEGLAETIDALRRAGIAFVGAGSNRHEACAPIFVKLAGRKVAFLARSSVIVSAPTYATVDIPGVAFLDLEETTSAIRACRDQADLVVLLLHWGIEEYSFPSPSQRSLAKELIAAGADLLLGHHPHVLQGIERIGSGMAAHSLGNFAFDEFEWSYPLENGTYSRQLALLSPANRQGVIATFEWDHDPRLAAPTAIMHFTRIADRVHVDIDSDPQRYAEWRRLCNVLERRPLYNAWWRAYALGREWSLRLGEKASPAKALRNIHRIRPRHIARACSAMLRSLRIVRQKSTNPYE